MIWRPFTQEKTVPPAINVVKGEGLYLYTEDGKKYADMISSWWVNIHGHANPEIAEAIAVQAKTLEHVIFTAFSHQPAQDLVEKLKTVLPAELGNFFFSDNGSTSVEIALKMAYQFFKNQGNNKRKVYLHLEGSYHGDTYGAMSVAGKNSVYHETFSDFFFDTISVEVPEFYEGVENIKEKEDTIISDLEKTLEQRGEEICALIVEPLVQGARGMVMYRSRFLERLIRTVRKFGILVIFDEVFTGFYRTGRFWAMDYLSEKPDILCASKALTGGFLPLGLTVASQKIFDAFLSDDFKKSLIHGHSYTGNPISCAAACKSFEILIRPETLKYIACIENIHKSIQLKNVQKRRTLGTITAFDFSNTQMTQAITSELFENGIFVRPIGATIYFVPPYCITKEELEHFYEILSSLV